MAQFPTNHDEIYFDVTCRTKKSETVLSLIMASYQVPDDAENRKEEIASILKEAYEVLKGDAGSYSGESGQFASQYTIGHEMCIWKNENLELTDLALKVAKNRITIRDYFDVVFLNYIQVVNNKVVHVLYHLLAYMKKNKINIISKSEMIDAYSEIIGEYKTGKNREVYNMLISTNYFKPTSDKNSLVFCASITIEELMNRCDVTYINKAAEDVFKTFEDSETYIDYLLNDHNMLDAITGEESRITSGEIIDEEYLGKILMEMRDNAKSDVKSESRMATAIHIFGMMYGDLIEKLGLSPKKIGKYAGVSNSNMEQEYSKGAKITKYLEQKSYDFTIDNGNLLGLKECVGGKNRLLYGVPGVGKSYYIDKYMAIDKSKTERVVFHPDYMYSDFVGQVMPTIEKQADGNEVVRYEFQEGPFTRILKRAINNPGSMYYLVIEELNRGNAPAIFGDIFQLLDRDEKGKSEYQISNFDIAKEIYGNKNKKVFIPSNLTILATMNTADQNVFTLDTAFQRRWDMKLIPNNFDSDEHAEQYNAKIEDDIKWGKFAVEINKKISDYNKGGIGRSDKRMGLYFIKANDLTNKEKFASKVLKYLWDDAFKLEPETIFNENINNLEELIEKYLGTDDKESALEAVLKNEIYLDIIESNVEDQFEEEHEEE